MSRYDSKLQNSFSADEKEAIARELQNTVSWAQRLSALFGHCSGIDGPLSQHPKIWDAKQAAAKVALKRGVDFSELAITNFDEIKPLEKISILEALSVIWPGKKTKEDDPAVEKIEDETEQAFKEIFIELTDALGIEPLSQKTPSKNNRSLMPKNMK